MTDELNDEPIVYKAGKMNTGERVTNRWQSRLRQGMQKRLVVCKKDGTQLFDVPLAAALAVSGGVALVAPFWAVVGGLATLVAPITLEMITE
ncbi:MAG: DUF4342 domain-containing protein [Anaerolineales bacterium]|nr:DUF4342 domain-containing protein [Anaerolineales bacterium]